MVQTVRSPRVLSLAWGRLAVEGQADVYKDAKLFPGGARAWDWHETGTRHTPGIQPADVVELLDQGAGEVVLAQGFHRRLQVCPETFSLLQARHIPVHVLETEAAVRRYNELYEQVAVGALIHSTC